ncbi:MAG: hydroxymethylbilane synthase [Thermoproteus sp.]|nr:hydroxymethylbilane synthase [Thermoproteus sp.]
MKIKVATRGSKLSLAQTELMLKAIRAVEPGAKFEILIVKTAGDLIQDKPLYAIGVKGIFEKEVDLAVLKGEADLAIHSLKDLPSEIGGGLVIAGYSKRDPPFDVIASREGYGLEDLPKGAVVGTSSVRRAAFLKKLRPDVEVRTMRGNVDTRISKILKGEYDAAVLAEAGIVRLYGATPPVKIRRLRPEDMPPPPGQGIVAAVAREGDGWILDILRKASDQKATGEATAERAFLREMGGGCHTAVGGLAEARPDGTIEFLAGYASPNGSRAIIVRIYGEEPRHVGEAAARLLKREIGAGR